MVAKIRSGKLTKKKGVNKGPVFQKARKKALESSSTARVAQKQCRGMDIDRFYAFSQCSLKFEAKHFMELDVKLSDSLAIQMWPHFEKMAMRNLGKNEKLVPFHTVLGVHENYVVSNIHHAPEKTWNDYRSFVLMFIFRAHCKTEVFDLQKPFLTTAAFWKDPSKTFNKGSPMHKMLRAHRAQGNALQTNCFLIIPEERLAEDDNENLVLNLLRRTQRLIKLAEELWPLVNDKKTSAESKFAEISKRISAVKGMGETWVKMLTVVVDIARPEIGLLHDRCEVGSGAADPLRKILEDEGILKPKVKKERDPEAKKVSDKFEPFPFCGKDFEIVAIKKKGQQLSQVTVGAAGSLDRAYTIALALCSSANKGASKEQVETKKQGMLANKALKFPKLGMDAKRKTMLAKKQSQPKEDRSAEPTPMEGLVQLRDRITAASGTSSGRAFWKVLAEVEARAARHFKKQPLTAKQFTISKTGLSCVTLQVQLCEFRQFNNILGDSKGTKRSRGSE